MYLVPNTSMGASGIAQGRLGERGGGEEWLGGDCGLTARTFSVHPVTIFAMNYPLALLLAAMGTALVACQDETSQGSTGGAERLLSAAGPGGGSGLGSQANAGVPSVDRLVIDDAHRGGQADAFQLQSVSYGRIVELWGETSQGGEVRVAQEFVIGETFTGDGQSVELVTQPVLGIDRLFIHEAVDDRSGGRSRFLALAEAAALTTSPVSDAGADGSGHLSVLPRNAAFVLQFNDLVEESSLTQLGAMLKLGSPAIVNYEARLAAHDLIGGFDALTGAFHSTRIIVDFTLSAEEANRTASPFAVNPTGLPAGTGGMAPDAVLLLPTVSLAGISSPLVSSGGTHLGVSPGSVDYASATQDLIRPFRIGSRDSEYRGFLMDNDPPRLVAEAEVQITAAPQQDPLVPDTFVLPRVQFTSFGCAGPAQVGDIISQPGVIAEVIADGGAATAAGLDNLSVRLLEFPPAWTGPEQWQTDGVGVAFYQAPYDLMMDDLRIACLLGVTPSPVGGMQAPTRGVAPNALFDLRFNEPMGEVGENQMESVLISRTPIAPAGPFNSTETVVAVGTPIGMSPFTGGFLVNTEVPLAHEAGSAEVYYLTPRIGDSAVRDLAGNALMESPGPIAMSVDPSAETVTSGGVLLGFNGPNELGAGGASLSGQFSPSFNESLVRPRPVIRFQGNVDNSQPILQQQTPFPQGVRTPFTPFGARLQAVWRYCDMGFGLTDTSTINIDVEGLYWAPSNNVLNADTFSAFEIKLSHARFAPDEVIDPNSQFPQFQNSGLRPLYTTNVFLGESQEVVHPRQLGYTFSSGDLVMAPTGETLAPFPLNRVTGQQKRTFTWRDTAKRGRAGLASGGVEPLAYLEALGLPAPLQPYFRTNDIQTIGLPLLLDMATFPDPGASGFNGWVLNLAVNSSSRPFFRAFSAGGVNVQGNSVFVDPDAETSANGGFSPGSIPPGQATFGRDNSLLLGAADFVVRKSLAHTVWLNTDLAAPSLRFSQPLASTPFDQPLGVGVRVDVRGATEIAYDNSGTQATDNDTNDNAVVDYLEDANLLDLYGDFYNEVDGVALNHWTVNENPGLTFSVSASVPVDSDWRADASTIEGARYVQLRLTMESDIETGATPSVSAIGIAWVE